MRISIGAQILVDASLADDFTNASGECFDNDKGRFAPPHPDAHDPQKVQQIMSAIETVLATTGTPVKATAKS